MISFPDSPHLLPVKQERLDDAWKAVVVGPIMSSVVIEGGSRTDLSAFKNLRRQDKVLVHVYKR